MRTFFLSRFGIGIGMMSLVLSGCAAMQAGIAPTIATAQVTTLDEAEQATKIAANAADTIVNTANLSHADLLTARSLKDAVSAALTPLETASANGQSLDFTAINAALAAFYAFEKTRSAAADSTSTTPVPSASASASASN